MAENIKIREIVHHGNYRHERVVEVYKITEDTVRGILISSAYSYNPDFGDERARERRQKLIRNAVEDLQNGVTAEYGWSRFNVIE